MNIIVLVTASIVVFCVIVTCGCVNAPGGDPGDDTKRYAAVSELMTFQGDVSIRLHNLGDIAEKCSAVVAESGADERSVTEYFDGVVEENPAVYSIVYLNESGTVRISDSGIADSISGMNFISQGSVKEQTEKRVPMMTDNFVLHDGTSASALYYPVSDSKGIYRGFLSLTFLPYELVKDDADDISGISGLSAMVAQPDGLILYDPDPGEVGQETFGNPEYENFPEIIAFAKLYSKEWSGSYEYSFYNTGFEKKLNKEAFWTTVSMWDNNWRVFVIRNLPGN